MAEKEVLEGDVLQFLNDWPEPVDGSVSLGGALGRASSLVNQYFSLPNNSGGFTGSLFTEFAGGGDSADSWDRFESDDFVAVSLLSVRIPGQAAIEILDSRRREFNSLLSQVPNDVALHDASDSDFAEGSIAWELYERLRKVSGSGPVTASKLLARKRPHLIPVSDQIVKSALFPTAGRYWVPLRNELQMSGSPLLQGLREIQEMSNPLAQRTSLLRILDVLVWLRHRVPNNNSKPDYWLGFKPNRHHSSNVTLLP
jgi:hypothetical protein